MPLFIPFLLGGAAVLTSLIGVKSAADGLGDYDEAERRRDLAQHNLDDAEASQQRGLEAVNARAEQFGRAKLAIARDTCGAMLAVLEDLRRRGRLSTTVRLDGVDLATAPFVGELRAVNSAATSLLGGLATGAVQGAAAGVAAYGLAGAVGVAGTGAAISGLSGAAATSAGLAWLGGGSLAAGGLGVAGGTAVLGGIVAAPVLLIGGLSIARGGSDALTEAVRWEAAVDEAVAAMRARIALLGRVQQRIDELARTIGGVRDRADGAIRGLRARVRTFDFANPTHTARLADAMRLTRALMELLAAPIVTADGEDLDGALPGLLSRVQGLSS